MRRNTEMTFVATARIAGRRGPTLLALAGALLLAACGAQQGSRDTALAPQQLPGGAGAAPPSVSLAGTWQLDLRASGRMVDARGMPVEAPRPGFGGRPGGGGGYGGRPGGYPRDDAPGRAGRDSLPRDSLARDSVMREMGRLVIEQADSALTFTQGRSAPLLVYTDWRETRIPGRYGPWDVTFVTGSWHGTRFDVRRVLPSRTVLVESYEVSNDGARLTVTTRIAHRGDERGEILPREGRRIYNRATSQ
jgi:hypothetical protein